MDIAIEGNARDRGLVRGIGAIAFAAAITNEVVGSGIYRLPASMASAAGTFAPYAYLGCLFAMGAVVLCFAEAGSRVPTSGGPYGYVTAALGPLPGFVAGVLLWLSAVLACGGVAAALADTVASAFPSLGGAGFRAILIIGIIVVIALVNMAGVDLAAKVIGWSTALKLVPLGLFLLVGLWGLAMGHHATRPIETAPTQGLGRAVILAMFALSGMETPLGASGEVRNPSRNVPLALVLAMGSIGLLYIAIQLVADGLLGASLIGSRAPLADALGTIAGAWRAPLLAGAFVSMFFWIGSDLLGAPRVLFALSRDGLLPAFLGRLNPRTRTPNIAIAIHAVISIGLALTGTFEQLAVLSTLAIAPLYAAGCASAWILRRRGTAVAGTPFVLAGLPLVAVVGIVAMAALVAMAQPAEIVGLLTVLGGSALLYFAMREIKVARGR